MSSPRGSRTTSAPRAAGDGMDLLAQAVAQVGRGEVDDVVGAAVAGDGGGLRIVDAGQYRCAQSLGDLHRR